MKLAGSGIFSSILAVEPEPGNYRALTKMIDQNAFDTVQCLRCAAGMVDGMINLHVNRSDSLKSSIKRKNESDVVLRAPVSTVETY